MAPWALPSLCRRLLALSLVSLISVSACGNEDSGGGSPQAALTGPLGSICCDTPEKNKCVCLGTYTQSLCQFDGGNWVKGENCSRERHGVPSTAFPGCAEDRSSPCQVKMSASDPGVAGVSLSCPETEVPTGCSGGPITEGVQLVCCPDK